MKLEDRLTTAGKNLSQLPSSEDGLLRLLDRIEKLLSKVEQSPTNSMLTAIAPLMETLITEKFMKHSDVDVKVGVASCISEIVRISAPDTPYDDDKMKDVFHLIVSCFEDLYDTANRSYLKRVAILETMAKVRHSVIMLDLEMDQLIIEMFEHFFRAARVNHPEIVVESMEAVMALVLEESGDISSALLMSIVAILRKNNEEILTNAKKLADKVIQNGAEKLKFYLNQASKILDQDRKDDADSICWDYGCGESGIIHPPMEDECTKGPKIHWVWIIVKKLSYNAWIKRYCGRKATNPCELVSAVLWLLGTDEDEGQYMGLVDNGLRDEFWIGVMTYGPETLYWARESVILIIHELGQNQIKSIGISFSAGNKKQTWAQAIGTGRSDTCTSHLVTNPRIRVKEGENVEGEILGLDGENRASRRAYPLRFDGTDLIRGSWRAEQQDETKDWLMLCVIKLMQGRCAVGLLILGFGIATVQEWAMAEECYLGYAIIGPINKIWKRGIDRGPISIIRVLEFIRIHESEEQAEGIEFCHSKHGRFEWGSIGNLSENMMVEFGVEGVWAYWCKRPRDEIGCEQLHEENRSGGCWIRRTTPKLGIDFPKICITLDAESKLSNEAGVLHNLMRKVVNFSTLYAFKVFLEYGVNLSQYNEALNVGSWVGEIIRLLGKLGGLNKGLELMNQKKRCGVRPDSFVFNGSFLAIIICGILDMNKKWDRGREVTISKGSFPIIIIFGLTDANKK